MIDYGFKQKSYNNGNRNTLKILSELVDFNIIEIPSGTECFERTIHSEWNVKEAWIKDSKGNVIVDFKKNNIGISRRFDACKKLLEFLKMKI